MPSRASRHVVAALLVAALSLAGCGVRPEDRPQPIHTTAPAPTESDGDPHATGPRLTVFFVRDAALAAVQRPTDVLTSAAALDLLVDGPTRVEVSSGIRTVLAPEIEGVNQEFGDGLATVSVTRGFAGLTGTNQLLAVAQVVWTLTDLASVTAVRFVVEGAPVEVPTDDGLTDRPVVRDDYRSVAPIEPAPPTPPAADDSDATGGSAPG